MEQGGSTDEATHRLGLPPMRGKQATNTSGKAEVLQAFSIRKDAAARKLDAWSLVARVFLNLDETITKE